MEEAGHIVFDPFNISRKRVPLPAFAVDSVIPCISKSGDTLLFVSDSAIQTIREGICLSLSAVGFCGANGLGVGGPNASQHLENLSVQFISCYTSNVLRRQTQRSCRLWPEYLL